MSMVTDSLKPQALGSYRLVRRIGAGGMGDVYEAYETALDRRVAVKVLPDDLAQQEDFIKRFRREATAAGSLTHPNIVSVHYFGQEHGQYYFVMQYVPGQSLAARLAQQPPLTVDEKLDIFEQCLAGLAAAHQAGLIHRDIKPANILLNSHTGQAMLADFGLVKSTSSTTRMTITGVVLGTVDYLAPEQAMGRKLDGRADLYSLGVVVYQLLSGRLPFESRTPGELTYQHAYETPPPLWQVAPNSPAPLVRIIERLMAKDPAERYPTAVDVLADVRSFRRGESISSDAESFPRMILAPPDEFLPQVPRVAIVDHSRSSKTFWQRIADRLLHRLAEHAPQLVDALQTTTQQVDRAVDQHQRRRNELARLINAAERSLHELQGHADSYRHAAESVARRPTLQDQPSATRDDESEYRTAAAELDQQIAKQQAESNQMRSTLEKADAQLIQLRAQRDLSIARLRAAERALTPARRRVRTWQLAVVALLLLVAAIIFMYSVSSRVKPNDLQDSAASSQLQLKNLESKLDPRDLSDISVAKQILAIDPAHPAANLLVGEHFCFLKNDWDRGLPYLAAGSHPEIAETARAEREHPTDAAATSLELADAWWKISEAEKENEEVFRGIRSRALEWYVRAIQHPEFPEAQIGHVEERLLQADGVGKWVVFNAEVETTRDWTAVQFTNAPFSYFFRTGMNLIGKGWGGPNKGEIRFGTGVAYGNVPVSLVSAIVVKLPEVGKLGVTVPGGVGNATVRLRRNGNLVFDVTSKDESNFILE